MRTICITIYLSVIGLAAFAQYGKDYRTLGDQAFMNKDYYEAAFYYRKSAEGMHLVKTLDVPFQSMTKKDKKTKPADADYVSYRLGESYRLYENYIEAEGWYYKVLNSDGSSQYPLVRLWYGVCLRANQRFDEAINQLQQFNLYHKPADSFTAIANKEIANCNFAKDQYKYPILIDVVKMKGSWNSDGSDYAMLKRDSTFYFTSSRYAKDDKKHLNNLYRATAADDFKPHMIEIKDKEGKKETEFGTPSLSPDGKRMYFTRWYKEGTKTTHLIYFMEWAGNEWGEPHQMNNNVNAEGFTAIQPFVTADGKRLFFASNKPGGQGGDDIWMSDLNSDGDALNSTNLGPTINSAMDEQAPYYDLKEKKLIYSSKGWTGLGGFDFFESMDNTGTWSAPQNMGYPMNSAKDDLYFLPDSGNPNKYYIASDRQSDCCLNLFEVYDRRYILTGIINDCDTQKPLIGVKVTYADSLTRKMIKQIVTGDDGRYTFSINSRRPFTLMIEKKGYFSKMWPAPASGKMSHDTLYNPDLCLQGFEKNKPVVIKNVLYDYNKATLRPESKVVLNGLITIMKDNPQIIVQLNAHTDSKGTDQYNLKLSQARAQACVDYMISQGIAEKRVFAKGYGESMPIAPNTLPNGKDNPEGRQRNRRTEFVVVKTE